MILVSTFGEKGGLFVLDDDLKRIDGRPSAGLCLRETNELVRLLMSPEPEDPTVIRTYCARGVADVVCGDLHKPHDITEFQGKLVAVSTASNSILWIDQAGDVQRRWVAPGEGDSWHINCLCVDDGRLYASAFSRSHEHRGWVGNHGSGHVFDVALPDTPVLNGLTAPHNLQRLDGGWLLSQSSQRSTLCWFVDQRLHRSVELKGWLRGLAVTDDHLYVGSNTFGEDNVVIVLDRSSWGIVDEIPIPVGGIYGIYELPDHVEDWL